MANGDKDEGSLAADIFDIIGAALGGSEFVRNRELRLSRQAAERERKEEKEREAEERDRERIEKFGSTVSQLPEDAPIRQIKDAPSDVEVPGLGTVKGAISGPAGSMDQARALLGETETQGFTQSVEEGLDIGRLLSDIDEQKFRKDLEQKKLERRELAETDFDIFREQAPEKAQILRREAVRDFETMTPLQLGKLSQELGVRQTFEIARESRARSSSGFTDVEIESQVESVGFLMAQRARAGEVDLDDVNDMWLSLSKTIVNRAKRKGLTLSNSEARAMAADALQESIDIIESQKEEEDGDLGGIGSQNKRDVNTTPGGRPRK